jgi:hypothetical protein
LAASFIIGPCRRLSFDRNPSVASEFQVAELVGIYALILQAADKPLGKRYKKWGFEYFLGEEEKPQPNMFIALETIKKAKAKTAAEAAS